MPSRVGAFGVWTGIVSLRASKRAVHLERHPRLSPDRIAALSQLASFSCKRPLFCNSLRRRACLRIQMLSQSPSHRSPCESSDAGLHMLVLDLNRTSVSHHFIWGVLVVTRRCGSWPEHEALCCRCTGVHTREADRTAWRRTPFKPQLPRVRTRISIHPRRCRVLQSLRHEFVAFVFNSNE
jgi:hypothetical protein